MTTKKKLAVGLIASMVVVAAVAGVIWTWMRFAIVDFHLYPRESTQLDLRGQDVSIKHYEKLRKQFPGCDIQWTGSAVDARGIADFFHPRERLALDALPPDDYARGFYRMWVRKEAVMKACGKGLGTGLDRVLVSAESGGHHASIQEALPDEGEHWWAPCAIGRDGYAVALAIPENEAPRPIIRHRLEIPFR